MPVDLVTQIAGESDENRTQREQLTKQLDVLMRGSKTCRGFMGVRVLSMNLPSLSLSEPLLTFQQVRMMARFKEAPSSNLHTTVLAMTIRSLTTSSLCPQLSRLLKGGAPRYPSSRAATGSQREKWSLTSQNPLR